MTRHWVRDGDCSLNCRPRAGLSKGPGWPDDLTGADKRQLLRFARPPADLSLSLWGVRLSLTLSSHVFHSLVQ